MKFAKQVVITIIVCLLLQLFLPWWVIAIGPAGAAYWIGNKPILAFLAGFLSIMILWLCVAFYIDLATASILTQKINKLLPLNAFLLTGIVGGLIGGMASLTGALVKPLVNS